MMQIEYVKKEVFEISFLSREMLENENLAHYRTVTKVLKKYSFGNCREEKLQGRHGGTVEEVLVVVLL